MKDRISQKHFNAKYQCEREEGTKGKRMPKEENKLSNEKIGDVRKIRFKIQQENV